MTTPVDENLLFDSLSSGVIPEQIPEVRQALKIVPVNRLMRSLFPKEPVQCVLRVSLILALAKADGRFDRERIRTLAPFINREAVDPILDALVRGGWLELRAVDNTYRLHPLGFYVLSLLIASDFDAHNPANLLVRAAEVLTFGDRVDTTGAATDQLLGVLLAELETQADTARDIIQRGRPRQLIAFSRAKVKQQLQQVEQVLSAIEERRGDAAEYFGRIVRIHEAMQSILRAHESLARRLAEWNLKKLEVTGAGYSLNALTEAVMGASEDELLEAFSSGALFELHSTGSVSTDRFLTRYRTSRPGLAHAKERFEYEPPSEPHEDTIALEDVDPVSRIRQRLRTLVDDLPEGESLRLSEWLGADARDFLDAVLLLNLLAHIQSEETDGRIDLGTGVAFVVDQPDLDWSAIAELSPNDAVLTLEKLGQLDRVPERGLHTALHLTRASNAHG